MNVLETRSTQHPPAASKRAGIFESQNGAETVLGLGAALQPCLRYPMCSHSIFFARYPSIEQDNELGLNEESSRSDIEQVRIKFNIAERHDSKIDTSESSTADDCFVPVCLQMSRPILSVFSETPTISAGPRKQRSHCLSFCRDALVTSDASMSPRTRHTAPILELASKIAGPILSISQLHIRCQ
jgi:hypothetical protein